MNNQLFLFSTVDAQNCNGAYGNLDAEFSDCAINPMGTQVMTFNGGKLVFPVSRFKINGVKSGIIFLWGFGCKYRQTQQVQLMC